MEPVIGGKAIEHFIVNIHIMYVPGQPFGHDPVPCKDARIGRVVPNDALVDRRYRDIIDIRPTPGPVCRPFIDIGDI